MLKEFISLFLLFSLHLGLSANTGYANGKDKVRPYLMKVIKMVLTYM